MMKPTKEKIRDKIVTNGFTLKELLSLRRDYKDTKKTFHPDLTKALSFQDVIYKKAREALSPVKIFAPVALFFLIPPLVSKSYSYFFMPIFFCLFGLWDILSTARESKITIVNHMKLIKLAVRIMF
ncbi:hypothetical protein DER63_13835 [Salmonella enterica]|nr:hypothetical protein [Salmonella enterica]